MSALDAEIFSLLLWQLDYFFSKIRSPCFTLQPHKDSIIKEKATSLYIFKILIDGNLTEEYDDGRMRPTLLHSIPLIEDNESF